MSKNGILGIAAFVLFAAFLAYTALGTRRFNCEVCIQFGAGEQCRTANGDDRDGTIQLATDNACAFLARGRAESIRCGRTEPSRVRCQDRQAPAGAEAVETGRGTSGRYPATAPAPTTDP